MPKHQGKRKRSLFSGGPDPNVPRNNHFFVLETKKGINPE